MLKTENRLKKNKQFNYIYKHGDAKHSKNISLVSSKTKYGVPKIGFTVSKKVGNSVVRNKVKRHLREIIKSILRTISPNYNYILIAREGIDQVEFNDLKIEVVELFKRAGKIEQNS